MSPRVQFQSLGFCHILHMDVAISLLPLVPGCAQHKTLKYAAFYLSPPVPLFETVFEMVSWRPVSFPPGNSKSAGSWSHSLTDLTAEGLNGSR